MAAIASGLTVYDPPGFKDALPKINCSEIDYETVSYNMADKKRKLFFVSAKHARPLVMTLGALAGTVTNCSGLVRPGSYHPGNVFLIYLDGQSNETELLKKTIFSDPYIRRHAHVAVFEPMEDGSVLVHNFNIYRGKEVLIRRWSLKNQFAQLEDVFPTFPMEVSHF